MSAALVPTPARILLGFYLARTRAVYRRDTAAMYDPCALLPLSEPDLLRWQDTPCMWSWPARCCAA